MASPHVWLNEVVASLEKICIIFTLCMFIRALALVMASNEGYVRKRTVMNLI